MVTGAAEAGAGVRVPTRGSQSASRAASVLLLLSEERRPLSLTEVANRLKVAKSSTLGVLVSLEASGLVARRENGGYTLAVGVLQLAGGFLQSFDVVDEFRHAVQELPLLSQEVVQLAVLTGRDVMYLSRHTGRSPLVLTARVGDRFPASITAVGNALLAELDDDEVRALYAGEEPLPRWTGRSTRTVEALLSKLRRTRERGYALDAGETNPDVCGLAVPVRRMAQHQHDLAVGVSLRPVTVPPAHRDAVVKELRALRVALEAANVIE